MDNTDLINRAYDSRIENKDGFTIDLFEEIDGKVFQVVATKYKDSVYRVNAEYDRKDISEIIKEGIMSSVAIDKYYRKERIKNGIQMAFVWGIYVASAIVYAINNW